MIASVPRRRRSPLHDGSLYQPKRPAFWAYVVIMVLTGIVSFGQQSFFRQISPAGWALSWALLAVYALPVLFLVYVLDLYEREPLSLVIGALLWGAVAATTLSGVRERRLGSRRSPRRRTGVRRALDGRAHGAVRRGDPQGPGRGADLPDRARRVRRHDGRLRLRRRVRPGVRGRRGRLLLHGRVRRSSERRAAGVLRPGRGERAVLARPLHRTRRDGHRVLRVSAHASPARAAGHRARGLVGRRRARALPVELAPPRPVPRAAMERRGSGHDPRRDGGERASAPRVRDARGGAGPPTRAHVAARRARRRDRRPGHLRGRARDARGREAAAPRRSAACGRAPGATPQGSSAASSANR